MDTSRDTGWQPKWRGPMAGVLHNPKPNTIEAIEGPLPASAHAPLHPFDTIRLVKLPVEKQDLGLMRAMFSTVAPRYDFFTRVFSYGMDGRWKKLGVERAQLQKDALVLDLACGTGDFSLLIKQHHPDSRPVVVDLTEPMLR